MDSIKALKNFEIDNVVIDHDKDGVLTPFSSTQRSNDSRKVIV